MNWTLETNFTLKFANWRPISFEFQDYLEWIILCVECQNRDPHLLEFPDKAGVAVVLLDVAVAELSRGEPIVELLDGFARQHGVQIPVTAGVKMMTNLIRNFFMTS